MFVKPPKEKIIQNSHSSIYKNQLEPSLPLMNHREIKTKSRINVGLSQKEEKDGKYEYSHPCRLPF
jgi:hypothetical protein